MAKEAERQSSEIETRNGLLVQIADRIVAIQKPHPTRVGIDGSVNSGKTTLADLLVPLIAGLGRPVIRASIDYFNKPRTEKFSKGRESSDGFYEDQIDFAILYEKLLDPLGPNGNRRYRAAHRDWETDSIIDAPEVIAPDDAVVLFDGVFLLRPELRNRWDMLIYVNIDFDTAIQRALTRDVSYLGAEEQIRNMYEARYHPALRWYRETFQPLDHADIVVDNNDYAHPKLIFPHKR